MTENKEYSFIANVNLLIENLENINAIVEEINKLVNISTNMTDINRVSTNMTDINRVSTNMTDINRVSTNMADINRVSTNMTDINRVSTNMTDINRVSTNMADINQLSLSIKEILEVGSKAESISEISEELKSDLDRYNSQNKQIIQLSQNLISNLSNIDRVVNDIRNIELEIKIENDVFQELLPLKEQIILLAENIKNINQSASNIEVLKAQDKKIETYRNDMSELKFEQINNSLKIDLNHAKILAKIKTIENI